MEEHYNIDGYKELANAVVIKSVKDYENALKRLKRKPSDINANRVKNDCERFFRNEISIYTDLDGEAIMRIIKQKVGGV